MPRPRKTTPGLDSILGNLDQRILQARAQARRLKRDALVANSEVSKLTRARTELRPTAKKRVTR